MFPVSPLSKVFFGQIVSSFFLSKWNVGIVVKCISKTNEYLSLYLSFLLGVHCSRSLCFQSLSSLEGFFRTYSFRFLSFEMKCWNCSQMYLKNEWISVSVYLYLSFRLSCSEFIAREISNLWLIYQRFLFSKPIMNSFLLSEVRLLKTLNFSHSPFKFLKLINNSMNMKMKNLK